MKPGLAVWALALLLALLLPGAHGSRSASPFPWMAALQVAGLLLIMVALALALTGRLGPRLGRTRALRIWEALPDLLWGALTLALWPAAWGPPGFSALALAFLPAALPGELRWLSQALPEESPLPEAWGGMATRLARHRALRHLLTRWLCARFPLWVTATLVLERILGLRGPGSDWMLRVAHRDRAGTGLWLLVFAVLWAFLQKEET